MLLLAHSCIKDIDAALADGRHSEMPVQEVIQRATAIKEGLSFNTAARATMAIDVTGPGGDYVVGTPPPVDDYDSERW